MSETPKKVKVLHEFLGIPVGSIGEVVSYPSAFSVMLKFDCKPEPVLVGWPSMQAFNCYQIMD